MDGQPRFLLMQTSDESIRHCTKIICPGAELAFIRPTSSVRLSVLSLMKNLTRLKTAIYLASSACYQILSHWNTYQLNPACSTFKVPQ